ncbi:MAG: ATP synthase F0 subunit C [Bdellovibrionota bacterium]
MFSKSNVLGFFASAVVVLISTLTFASDGGASAGDGSWSLAIGAGLGMGLAAFGGALGQGRAIGAAMEGIARNPGADKKIFTPMIIGLVFIEVMVILTFVITNGLSGKI